MEGIRSSREFLTFSPVSAEAHQSDGMPKGFIRIELSGGFGKYDAFLQNISKTGISGKDFIYDLYFGRFVKASSGCMIVPGGAFVSKGGGFEASGKFNTADFLGTSHTFEDFNAILVFRDFEKNSPDRFNPHVIMTAFRGVKLPDWRDYLDVCLSGDNPGTYTGTAAVASDVYKADKAAEATEASEADAGFTEGVGDTVPAFGSGLAADAESASDAGHRQQPAKFDYKSLIECLDRNFLRVDPFRVRRRDYRWWRIDSPAHLNNVLQECNIRASVLFNPNLIMAHHMYKYLIAGIYSDRISGRVYFVCGIPGEWSARDKPFGEYCRWVQAVARRPGRGFMGYWLVYFDLMSGKYLGFQ